MPVSWLSIEAARFVFLAVGTAACVAVVTSRGAWGLHALVSGAMLQVFQFVQWPPLEMGALALSPVLAGAVWSAKPTIGLAFFAAYAFPDARRMQRALLGGVAMLAISLAFRPNWPLEWLAAIRYAPHVIAPVTLLPLGPIALAALARWRRPEARLIAALACVPQTFVPLATLPLFLVPRSRAEMLTLLGASWLLLAYWYRFPPIEGTPLGLAARVRETGQVIIALSYLPCLAMVLRRPNEGIVPQWMERISDRLPPWLGGCAPVTR
jgi:hypothetical protein